MTDPLVDAFADALRVEPAPLEASERRAVVRAALERLEDEALVDAFAEALRGEEPSAVDEPRVASRALAAAVAPAGRRWWAAAAVASVVLAIGVGLWAQLLFTDGPPPEPVVHRLAGGHRITATAGSRLSIEERGAAVRVALERGEALFDVARGGSSFEVRAGAVRVLVTGTVFAVRRSTRGASVRVYEGSVRVEDGGRSRRLEAGDRFGGGAFDEELVALGREAARRRSRTAEAPSPGEAPRPASAPEPRPELDPDPDPDRSPAPPRAAAPDRAPEPEPAPDLDDVRRALAARDYDRALELLPRVPGGSAEHAMLRGDALRGQGRAEEALAAYRRAMGLATARERAIAGLEAARLLAGPLGRRGEAAAVLRDSGALEAGSPVASAARRLDEGLHPR